MPSCNSADGISNLPIGDSIPCILIVDKLVHTGLSTNEGGWGAARDMMR